MSLKKNAKIVDSKKPSKCGKISKAAKKSVVKKKLTTEKSLRFKLLALIHCNSTYKAIYAAGAWEDWLTIRFGVCSCKDLNERELGNILDIFSGKCEDRDYVFRQGTASSAQIKKIYAIMSERGFSAKARETFIIRQLGVFKPLYLLKSEEATKIITGLQKINGER